MNEQMDKDAILKAAQNEKNKGKEFENREGIRSAALGMAVSCFMTFLLLLLQYFVKGTVNAGFLAIGVSAGAAQYMYEGIKTKKKASLIIGIVASVLAVLFIVVFISQIFAKVWIV